MAEYVKLGSYQLKVPGARWQRVSLGIALCVLGVFGFLPILGFWMIPLGLLILSIDFHPIRRLRRRVEIWWGRRKGQQSPE